jgi:integrase
MNKNRSSKKKRRIPKKILRLPDLGLANVGHVRTTLLPGWVRRVFDDWFAGAVIRSGNLFRPVCSAGRALGEVMAGNRARHVVKKFTTEVGIVNLASHDFRRAWARLCHAAECELVLIQFLSGHVSVLTTEPYGSVADDTGVEDFRLHNGLSSA